MTVGVLPVASGRRKCWEGRRLPLLSSIKMRPARTLALFALGALPAYALLRRRKISPPMPDRAVNERPEAHHEQLDTYQALLDESLQLTFPASDPVCAHAATRCAHPCETPANATDWQLHAGSRSPADAPLGTDPRLPDSCASTTSTAFGLALSVDPCWTASRNCTLAAEYFAAIAC